MTGLIVDESLALSFGLSPSEWRIALEIVGRDPSLAELGIISAMWSEHCSYKSSKRWLQTLPTEAPWVLIGPGENAGVVDIGDGLAAVFKMESHNHPSFIEPYQGAATGVGGILRDVFTMGARPVANLNALRFGHPKHPKTKHLLSGVVAGIGGYGNCIGVPTVGGETGFDPAYNGNILVNAMTVGLARSDRIFTSEAAGIGNPVVYVGAKTGRDGIHGATMASAEFSEETEEKRPTVQVGDPFKEKLLLEACLELMDRDAIIAIQDMGAAGLTSSSVEMADKGGLGIDLDLDHVPMRETGMSAYEIMLSESQERMLMVLRPDATDIAAEIFAKWELDFAIIGRLTDTGRLVIRRHGQVEADLEVAPLVGRAPVYDRPWIATPKAAATVKHPDAGIPPLEALQKLLGGPDLCSRSWIWEQYDSEVMGDTIAGPGGDSALVRVHGTKKALAMTADCTPRYVQADPEIGGAQAVAEAYRNLISVGARPLAVTNNLNFGNPEKPEIMGQIVGAVRGMGTACRALDMPVVSGNVSLYNETDGAAILPTPTIGAVGVLDDLSNAVGLAYREPNLHLLLIGESHGHLDCSLYQQTFLGGRKGPPPPVSVELERHVGDLIAGLIASGIVLACHDVADGGVLVAVAEMAMAAGIGAELSLGEDPGILFGEDQARYIIAVRDPAPIKTAAQRAGLAVRSIGITGGYALQLGSTAAISVDMMRRAHQAFLPDLMGG